MVLFQKLYVEGLNTKSIYLYIYSDCENELFANAGPVRFSLKMKF